MEYGCIGEKLSHSFSAEIHQKLFDYKYELKEIARDDLNAFMTARDFKAINVTIPYKQDVIPYLDEVDDIARRIGAVNTIINKDGRLYGYNTDFEGLKALIQKSGIEILGKKVLVLGSGGTSKTALAVAKALGAAFAYRVSRTGNDDCITYESATNEHTNCEVIINTTPCGMYPNIGNTAIDIDLFPRLCGVVDVVYNPLRSELVCRAQARGITAVGGLYMLVAQAAFAAEKFTGITVESSKIDSVFKEIFVSKENIVLIGMPASGKTTVGTRLAKDLGRTLIDTDEEIVKSEGVSIPEIFARGGEKEFRKIEADIIAEVSKMQGVIISTGGGAVLNRRNTELLRQNGRIYFLDRPLEKLICTNSRPLSSNRDDLKRRYEERYDIYCDTADLIIDAAGSIEENKRKIVKDFLDEHTCN